MSDIDVNIANETIEVGFVEETIAVEIVDETLAVEFVDETLEVGFVDETIEITVDNTIAVEPVGYGVYEAGEVINGHRLIYLKDGLAYKASYDNPECFNRIVGMSVNAANLGEMVTVRNGKIVNPGWGLTANALYFLGLDGQLTTVPPTTGILQEVGYSVETNEFYVNINSAIRR